MLGVIDGVGGAAARLRQIRDAIGALIDEVAVTHVHTAAVVALGGIDDLVGEPHTLGVTAQVAFAFPGLRLIAAGEHQNETDLGADGFAQLKHRLGGNGI